MRWNYNPAEHTLSSDGTYIHSHFSPYGHKTYKCPEFRIPHYSCEHHFSDPNVDLGWDSDEKVFTAKVQLTLHSVKTHPDGLFCIVVPSGRVMGVNYFNIQR